MTDQQGQEQGNDESGGTGEADGETTGDGEQTGADVTDDENEDISGGSNTMVDEEEG